MGNAESQTDSFKPVMQYWLWAISSGYVSPIQWVAWADDVLMRCGEPPMWVIEMSSTSDKEDCSSQLQTIVDDFGLPLDVFNPREVYLGYRYAMLESGMIDLKDFFEEPWCCNEIDAAFYDYFPEADKEHFDQDDGPDWQSQDQILRRQGHDAREVLVRFAPLFDPWRDLALSQYDYLMNKSADDVVHGRCIPNR